MSQPDQTPGIVKTAFACPHCGVFTTQQWHQVLAEPFGEQHRTPTIPTPGLIDQFREDKNIPGEQRESLVLWGERMLLGRPFFESSNQSHYGAKTANSCFISQCYNCKEISVWVSDKIVYPNTKVNISPNSDMPEHVRALFEEAREIVYQSPKGAAALLRLSVQHLCAELGETGKNIDRDIASLVAKGLNPMVQQALDVVRVIGNESVHPGEIDLNDNQEVALKLFGLINLICEQMISHPARVQDLYSDLPQSKRDAIESRNSRAKEKPGGE